MNKSRENLKKKLPPHKIVYCILLSCLLILLLSARHWANNPSPFFDYLVGPYGIYSIFWFFLFFIFIWLFMKKGN